MRPILENGSSAWDPYTDKLQEEFEKIQNRAARFVTRNYVYETGSMTGILGQLKLESLSLVTFTLIGACKSCVKSLNSIARTAGVHIMLYESVHPSVRPLSQSVK